jgi:hypothetical protein
MPGPSILEVDGRRMEIPPTLAAIRLLDDEGTVLFSITSAGVVTGTFGAATFTGAVTFEGDVTFEADVFMTGLPTEDPGVDGQLYSNTNVLTLGVTV